MTAQVTASPPIQPAVIISDWLREMWELFVGIIYNYDAEFHPVAKLRSHLATCCGKIRQYNYDNLLILLAALWSGVVSIPASISLSPIGFLRCNYGYAQGKAATMALANIRVSKTTQSRSSEKLPHSLNQRNNCDAKNQQAVPSTRATSQRR